MDKLAALVHQLRTGDVTTRIEAVRALRKARQDLTDEAIAALGEALSDPGELPGSEPDFTPWSGGGYDAVVIERVCTEARVALIQIGVRAVPAITRALERSGSLDAVLAARGLGVEGLALATPGALEALERALRMGTTDAARDASELVARVRKSRSPAT